MRKEPGKEREQKVWCWGKDLLTLQDLSYEDEEWEFIQRVVDEDIGDCFLVSNYGRAFDCSKQEMCTLYPDDNRTRYVKVSLPQCPEGYENYNVHRLVASAFVKNPDPDKRGIIHHIDGDRANNKARNLLWVSTAEHGVLHSLKNNDLALYCGMVAEMRQAQPLKKMGVLLPMSFEEMREEMMLDEKCK